MFRRGCGRGRGRGRGRGLMDDGDAQHPGIHFHQAIALPPGDQRADQFQTL